jgi:hypothetical protein
MGLVWGAEEAQECYVLLKLGPSRAQNRADLGGTIALAQTEISPRRFGRGVCER